jgi:hypothetical protein
MYHEHLSGLYHQVKTSTSGTSQEYTLEIHTSVNLISCTTVGWTFAVMLQYGPNASL